MCLSALADPSAKQAKRIKAIETDYGAHFVDSAHIKGFWTFLKFDPSCTFDAFPFAVPIDATDKQVMASMIAAMTCASYYEEFIKRVSIKSRPDPSPTPPAI